MDENKVREAFLKIKKDMNLLHDKINKLDRLQKSYNDIYEETEKNYQLILDLQKNSKQINEPKDNSNIEELSKKIDYILDLDINFILEKKKDIVFKEDLSEVSDFLQENIVEEINSLKLDVTKEISKVYDTFYNELLDIKKEINKNLKKEDSKKKKKITKDQFDEVSSTKQQEENTKNNQEQQEKEQKKESKVKKAIKWLFVDEDEEDLTTVKQEIKK